MLTAMTKTKVGVFVVIALLTTTFLSVRYVGLDRFIGGYSVNVQLPEGGGLFENSEVTYRGVPVGRVSSLTATRDGVRATVRIEDGAPPIPAKVTAKVVDRSAIGEQYLDLRGGALGKDELGEGDRIVLTAADLPPSIDGMLRSSRDFVKSVPSDDLTTVIDETYEFTRGNGAHLARLVDTSTKFARTAEDNFLVTARLIDNSGTVLATQEQVAGDFKSFSKSVRSLADGFAEQDADWRRMIRATPGSARQIDRLFTSVGQPLGELMANMISTAEVFGTNAAGVRETMVRLPEGISITYAIMTSKGMRSGSQLSFFNPLPCVEGYEATTMRPGTDVSPGQPFNTKAGCDMQPSSGTNVRGPNAVLPGAKPGATKNKRPVSVTAAADLNDLMGANQ